MARLLGSPTLAASGDGRLELFVFDIEGILWHIWQTAWSNGWSDWSQAGQGSSWPASVAASGDGRLELFVAGDGGLQHSYQSAWSNGWSGRETFPATPSPVGTGFFAPGIAAAANGQLAAFVGNGAVWRLQQTAWSNGWSDWQPHGSPPDGFVVGPVTAQRSGDGRIEVFAVDDQGRMWNIRQTSADSGFSDWNDFGTPGPALQDRPGLARSADGRLELFVTGADGSIWHSWQTQASNGWSDWVATRPDPGTQGAAPDVRASGDGRLELFVVGADGNLWHSCQTRASNGWSDWFTHGRP